MSQSPLALLPEQPLEGHVVLENPLRRYKSSCHSEIAFVHCEKPPISRVHIPHTCSVYMYVLLDRFVAAIDAVHPLPPVES
jgi:hypothetical protein